MQSEVLESAHDIGTIYKSAGNVGPTFTPHYVNMGESPIDIPDAETIKNRHGIAKIIGEILFARMAVFPPNIGDQPEHRSLAIMASMYSEDIYQKIQNQFTAGTDRYNLDSVRVYLSSLMDGTKIHYINGLPKVASIQLTANEDKPRPCKKPRKKYYLVQ